jgi:hypothetical protein
MLSWNSMTSFPGFQCNSEQISEEDNISTPTVERARPGGKQVFASKVFESRFFTEEAGKMGTKKKKNVQLF